MLWILEKPLPIVLVGLVTVAILIGGLKQTGKKWILYLIPAAVVLFGILLAVEYKVVTKREQVENTVYAIARAVEANDAEAVAQHVSPAKPRIRNRVRDHMSGVEIERAIVKSDLEVKLHPEQDPLTATARFHGLIIGGDRAGTVRNVRYAKGFIVEFVLEDEVWRVYDYEMREVHQSL